MPAVDMNSPHIVNDTKPPHEGLATSTASWKDDPGAVLCFSVAYDTCYIVGLRRGERMSGSAILQWFRNGLAKGYRVVVVGASSDTFEFYAKMRLRGLIDDWTPTDPEEYFGLDDDGFDSEWTHGMANSAQ